MAREKMVEFLPLMLEEGESDEEGTQEKLQNLWVDKLLRRKVERSFAANFALAARCAFFVVVCGIPCLLPKPWYDNLCIIYFVYTLDRTVGATLYNAVCCVKGTLIAVLNISVMHAIYPNGAEEEYGGVWWFGVAEGFIFILCFLWLNWDINTSVFAINTYIFYWVAFLHPLTVPCGDEGQARCFTKNFEFNWKNQETWELLAAVIGSALAVVATLVPYPLLSLDTAVYSVQELVVGLPDLWDRFADFFGKEDPNMYSYDKISNDIEQLRASITPLEGHISTAWWECMGMGRKNKVRTSLRATDAWLHRAHDRLFAAWTSVSADQDGDWGPRHKEFMDSVMPAVKAAIREKKKLMKMCLSAVADGDVDESEEEQLRNRVQSLREAESGLTKVFLATKRKMRIPFVTEEFLLEHSFCINLSSSCNRAAEFAESMLRQYDGEEELPHVNDGFMFDPRPILDPAVIFDTSPGGQVNFMFKSMCALTLGVILGYYGYPPKFLHFDEEIALLRPYSGDIAATASLLMAKSIGSAIVKNLGRVQGVVLGTVIGQFLHHAFMGCSAEMQVPLGMVLFFYSLGCAFVYYNSPTFSYLACLMGAFGATKILAPCASSAAVNYRSTYDAIVTTMLAVFFILIMDLLFSPERASDMAYTSMKEGWDLCLDSLTVDFDPDRCDAGEHSEEIVAKIASSEKMGKEAAMEPRYWRAPWREAVFDASVDSLRKIHYCMSVMEYTVAETSQGVSKPASMMEVERLASFRKLPELVQGKMAAVGNLLNIFVHEYSDHMREFDSPRATHEFRFEMQEALRTFMKDANDAQDALFRGKSLAAGAETLEEDAACRVSLIVGSFNAIMLHLRIMQHKLMLA